MNNIIRHTKFLLLFSLLLISFGCRKVVGPTNIRIEDPDRHYLPILQGDILRMYWTLYNDGPEPLVISQIQPACSAISLDSKIPDIIISGDSLVMIFDFDTEKNVNMANHTIRLFGNIFPTGVTELTFDVNVVRPSVDNSDFEEHFFAPGIADDVKNGKHVRINNYYTDVNSQDALLGL